MVGGSGGGWQGVVCRGAEKDKKRRLFYLPIRSHRRRSDARGQESCLGAWRSWQVVRILVAVVAPPVHHTPR